MFIDKGVCLKFGVLRPRSSSPSRISLHIRQPNFRQMSYFCWKFLTICFHKPFRNALVVKTKENIQKHNNFPPPDDKINAIRSHKPPPCCRMRRNKGGGFMARVAKIPKFSDFVKDLYLRKIFAASRQNGYKTRGFVAKGGLLCGIAVIVNRQSGQLLH